MTSLDPPQSQVEAIEGKTFSYYWYTWFRSIFSLLGYNNCRTESFIPTITGITFGGVNSVSSNYNIFRNRFNFSIDYTDNTSITISTGSTIDLKNLNKFVLTPINDGYCIISNTFTNKFLGIGVINNGVAHLPNVSVAGAISKVNISGFYLIEETK